ARRSGSPSGPETVTGVFRSTVAGDTDAPFFRSGLAGFSPWQPARMTAEATNIDRSLFMELAAERTSSPAGAAAKAWCRAKQECGPGRSATHGSASGQKANGLQVAGQHHLSLGAAVRPFA